MRGKAIAALMSAACLILHAEALPPGCEVPEFRGAPAVLTGKDGLRWQSFE